MIIIRVDDGGCHHREHPPVEGDSSHGEEPADLRPHPRGPSLGLEDVNGAALLALLKYPFYHLFNFDNGMNLISKSLTILTSARLLVVFAFAHIFWRYFIFCRFLTNFGA